MNIKTDNLERSSLIEQYGEKDYSRYVAVINVVVDWIREGIKTSNGYRAFTLEDYNKILSLDINEAWQICKIELDDESQELFNMFFNIYDAYYNESKKRRVSSSTIAFSKYSQEDSEYCGYLHSMGYVPGKVHRIKRK